MKKVKILWSRFQISTFLFITFSHTDRSSLYYILGENYSKRLYLTNKKSRSSITVLSNCRPKCSKAVMLTELVTDCQMYVNFMIMQLFLHYLHIEISWRGFNDYIRNMQFRIIYMEIYNIIIKSNKSLTFISQPCLYNEPELW